MTSSTTNSHNIILNGTITPHDAFLATAPCRHKGEGDIKAKYPGGEPKTSRLPRLPVSAPEGVLWNVYFPGGGIRGTLRRLSSEIQWRLSGQRGLSIADHRLNMIGTTGGYSPDDEDEEAEIEQKKGKKKKGKKDGEQPKESKTVKLAEIQQQRDKHPLISLYGKSMDDNSFIAGRLGVGHAIPENMVTPCIVTGVRKDDLRVDPDQLRFLTPKEADALDARVAMERAQGALKKAQDDNIKELRDRKKSGEDVGEELKEAQDNKSKFVSPQIMLPGYEAIPPGTDLNHRFTLRNGTDAELGLFFLTLREFALKPFLGAHYAHGCGVVRGQWRVVSINSDSTTKHLGNIELTPFEGLIITGELEQRVPQWIDAYIAVITEAGNGPH